MDRLNLKGSSASSTKWGHVLSFPKRFKERKNELSRMMKADPELAEFCQFVRDHGMRERAVELLSARINQDCNRP